MKYPNVFDWMIRMLEFPELKEQDKYIEELALMFDNIKFEEEAKL